MFRPISHPNTHSMAWKIADDTPFRRIFTRPLNPVELGFFYDSKLNGVADLVENYLVVTVDSSLFHPENVSRAWVAVKQIFPLLGATTKELESQTPSALFVVSELDLGIARPDDTTLGSVQSEEEVHSAVDQLISGPRQLSDELLARLYIYSRTDKPGHFHALFHHSHLIIDGTSALAMIRTFFDVLSLPPRTVVPDLLARLALCVGTHSLNPNKHLPKAQICWRRAAGQIIRQHRFEKLRVRSPCCSEPPASSLMAFVGRYYTPAGGHHTHEVQHTSSSKGNGDVFAGPVLPHCRRLQKALRHNRLCTPHSRSDGIFAGAPSKILPW